MATPLGQNMTFDLASESQEFALLLGMWDDQMSRVSEVVADDDVLMARMRRTEILLRSEGLWTSGPTTMLEVLRQEQNEVRNCRVLRWILDPLSPHGLGPRALDALLETITLAAEVQHIPVPAFDLPHQASVDVEEQRDNTRADLIIEGPAWTVVIEAKINAREQDRQGERLSELWPGATYVFLTRRGAVMTTAGDESWIRLSWGDVLAAIRTVVETAAPALPGSHAARARRTVEDYLYGARRLTK